MVATLLLGGCAIWRPTPVPIPTTRVDAACPSRPDTLLVFLPGSFSLPQEFIDNGFAAAVRARGIAADLLLVDAHMGYYTEKSIIDRLQADVVAPARARGYRQVWFVGISLGAFGAMIYDNEHAGAVDGIVALAPFLGSREIGRQIDAAGGLAAWTSPTPMIANDDIDRRLWLYLKRLTTKNDGAGARPAFLLGYGLDDRFEFNDRLLAAALPPTSTRTTPGGHDWPTWKALWTKVLDANLWPVDPACKAS
ncbi:MAG: alpha/beta hydrolase [Caldimonas sp.]